MSHSADNAESGAKPPRRRWFQFRLRSLLILMAILSVPLAWLGHELQQRRAEAKVVAELKQQDMNVYDWYLEISLSRPRKVLEPEIEIVPTPGGRLAWWIDQQLGKRVIGVRLTPPAGSGGNETPANEAGYDLTPLGAFHRLRLLEIEDFVLPNFEAIAGLDELVSLVFVDSSNESRTDDLNSLGKLTGLKSLELSNTSIDDLRPLATLTNLEYLALTVQVETDLSPLAELENLRWLYLDKVQAKDLTPLAKLEKLEGLFLENVTVDDLLALGKLKRLRRLVLGNVIVAGKSADILHPALREHEHSQLQLLRAALPQCEFKDAYGRDGTEQDIEMVWP